MDYAKTVSRIVKEFDLATETGRKKAFMKCIEYADARLSKSIGYNAFMQYAAKTLEQTPVVKPVIKRLIVKTGKERLHLTYSDSNGSVLTGNKRGLLYFSQILEKLSESGLAGDHIHFYYQEPPLYGNSYPITVYYENDKWFEEHAVLDETEERRSENETVTSRDVVPAEIFAMLITKDPPPGILISKGVLYKVLSCEKCSDQQAWKKTIRENSDRMYVFEFVNDDGGIEKLAVDLDDKDIIFFSPDQLLQIVKTT